MVTNPNPNPNPDPNPNPNSTLTRTPATLRLAWEGISTWRSRSPLERRRHINDDISYGPRSLSPLTRTLTLTEPEPEPPNPPRWREGIGDGLRPSRQSLWTRRTACAQAGALLPIGEAKARAS